MNIHEYQARTLLKAAGVPMLDGDVASTPPVAEAIARRLGGKVVVKAQVHAGGRGQGRRREAGRHAGRGRGCRRAHPGHADQGPHGAEGARGAGRGYRDRGICRPDHGPGDAAPGVHGESRGRDRHRGGRRHDAGEDPPPPGRSHATACCRTRRCLSRSSCTRTIAKVQRGGADHGTPLQGLHRQRLLARRDQSAGHHARRQGARARREDHHR